MTRRALMDWIADTLTGFALGAAFGSLCCLIVYLFASFVQWHWVDPDWSAVRFFTGLPALFLAAIGFIDGRPRS